MISVGDRVTVEISPSQDYELYEWLLTNDDELDFELIVTEINEDSNECWLDNYDNSIELDCVIPFNGSNYEVI